ncbi:MAG: general secretion pathway protein GspB [candidate division Zixibacteria bacterium]|nr:general secretion pathway protein GspB [candidate division Zixibacteria bacterium]
MDEARRRRVLYWVLVFAILFGFLNLKSIMSIGKKRTIADLDPSLASTPVAAGAPAAPDSFAYEHLTPEKQARLTLGFGRNPFYRGQEKAPVSAGPTRPEFSVSAISLRGSSAFAVINGRVVQVGDWLEGFRVHAITEGRVVLSRDGTLWNYPLKGGLK